MPARRWLSGGRTFACMAAACSLFASGGRPAAATPAVIGAVHMTEVRVAFARSPDWTTVWTSARIEDDAGPFALVVPLPDGAFVDQSTDAWFEALEAATAPRVFPPKGLTPYCPGQGGPDHPFEIAGAVEHLTSVPPETIAIEDDAAAVSAWATAHGLSIDAGVKSALGAIAGARFLCVRFTAPGGVVVTPALRITAPKGLPALPFSITRAGASNVRVSAWLLGDGGGSLDGSSTVTVSGDDIAWSAAHGTTSYRAFADALLASQPNASLLESAGHDALSDAAPIADGTASIDALSQAYFERASAYGNAPLNPDPCIDAAKAALASDQPVAQQCPRGDLAALGGACTSVPPGPGEVDPAALLCGPGADDLAVALSGGVPADTWVTRRTFVIAAGSGGKDRAVSFGGGAEKVPVLEAGGIDLGECFEATTSSSSSSSATGGAGAGGSFGVSVGGGGASSAGGNHGQGGHAGDDGLGGSDVYVDSSGCSCGGTVPDSTTDTVPVAQDDCGSDTTGSTASGDDCSSGSSSSSSSSGCGSDTTGSTASGDDCDSGSSSSSDSCSSGTGSDSSASDCALSRRPAAHRRNGPRLSVLTMALMALLMPLRRRGTKKKRRA